MLNECDRFRELAAGDHPAGDPETQRHAAQCPYCREQLIADRELRAVFQGIARPGPSPQFNGMLRERLRAERQLQRHSRWRLLVMQGYWIAAGAASAVVLMRVPVPGELPSVPVVCLFGAVFGLVLLTPAVLFLALRTGPVGLIHSTMEAYRR